MKSILGTSSSVVILNGVSVKKKFRCRRGVRQGDSLSPFFFVITVDLPQCIINRAHMNGILSRPLQTSVDYDYPIIQYIDDTLLFMNDSQKELYCLKAILNSFSASYVVLRLTLISHA